MKNRECIVFERTRDTEQRIQEPCASLCVHPVFNQSSVGFSGNIRVSAVAFGRWNLLLFLGLKTIKNSSGQMRQLYAYVATESTLHLKPFVDPPSILVEFFIAKIYGNSNISKQIEQRARIGKIFARWHFAIAITS